MKSLCVIIVLYLNIVSFTIGALLPSTYIRCNWKDPKFDECLTTAVEDALQQLKKGAPELKIDSLEPIKISEFTIGEGKGPVNIVQYFKNVEISGFTNGKMSNVRTDIPRSFKGVLKLPEVVQDADYTLNGRLLLLPISGSGRCKITLSNVTIDVDIKGTQFTKDGRPYTRLTDFTIAIKPTHVQYDFQNLFDGDATLGAEALKVLNDNWEEVFDDVRGGYERVYAKIGLEVSNKVFLNVALPDIFPGYDG